MKPSAISPGFFKRLSTTGAAPATGEPALHVALSMQDVDLLERTASTYSAAGAERLVLGSLLPSTIVGADAPTVDAAAVVLTTYRRASLVVAWLDAIGAGAGIDAGTDATSRRDEAAAAAMSMLRALLGEA